MRVEGPQDGSLGAAGRFGVVDAVDEEGQAQDVGEEDEFLPDFRAGLAGGGEEVDARHPFGGGEAGFACEVVQVCDEPFEDIFEARGGVVAVDGDDLGRGDGLGGCGFAGTWEAVGSWLLGGGGERWVCEGRGEIFQARPMLFQVLTYIFSDVVDGEVLELRNLDLRLNRWSAR